MAAGGTIPPEKADEFILMLDEYIGKQLNA
ncbi:MAG: DHH family phosphoesterase [Methanimicrococcus sp.]|nr:DHH family phosphoesterase [Methanimicrococcus sp.]